MDRLPIAFALAAFSITAGAADGPMTTGELHSFCNSTDVRVQKQCSLYILGVVQGATLAAGLAKDASHFCVPDDIGERELVAIFQKTALDLKRVYPDDMKLPAVSAVVAAISRHFPCAAARPALK
jgi:hypothetical protein